MPEFEDFAAWWNRMTAQERAQAEARIRHRLESFAGQLLSENAIRRIVREVSEEMVAIYHERNGA